MTHSHKNTLFSFHLYTNIGICGHYLYCAICDIMRSILCVPAHYIIIWTLIGNGVILLAADMEACNWSVYFAILLDECGISSIET